MIHHAMSKSISKTLALAFCFSSLFFLQVSTSNAENKDVVSANPAVAEYFKYRDNREEFQNLKATLQKNKAETQQLLFSLEQSMKADDLHNNGVATAADSQLKSKLAEWQKVRKEVMLGKQERLSRWKKQVSPLEGKVLKLSRHIEEITSASNKTQKLKAMKSLKAELKRSQTPKLRSARKVKQALEPNGMSYKAIPTIAEEPPKELEAEEKAAGVPVSYFIPAASVQQESTDTRLIKTFAADSLKAAVDFIIPSATAAEFQLPTMSPGVSACYANATEFNDNIATDLDLSQPEIEVDQVLDANAYKKITTLAAELNYSPVKILEYVTNNIQHEHYSGSVKGALGALESGGANDIDHASLLIALFRASSIPARYVSGKVYLQDKPEHLDWWNVKDIDAVGQALFRAGKTPASIAGIDGLASFTMQQAWVEACVPYDNYRGDGQGSQGHRWVPLDASFKQYERFDGESQSEVFDYSSFLAQRTRTLPNEEYEAQVLDYVRNNIDANLTLDDVGTRWQQKNISYEFLPDSLPYAIHSFTNWSVSLAVPKSAVLPEEWRAKVKVYFASDASFDIPMTDFAQHRITLSFVGNNIADNTKYLDFLDGTIMLDCASNNLTVKPVFKKDGDVINGPVLSPMTICQGDDFRNIDMGLAVLVNGDVVSSTAGNSNRLTFDTISPLDYYAFTSYAFNASDSFLDARNKRLFDKINSTIKPSDDLDGTIGEFLNLVLMKYMRYITDAGSSIGQLYGTTGRSGHHIGLTSTNADVHYILDLPYALQSNNFVIDVPGGLSKGVKLEGGAPDFAATRLAGYTASHYESYVWQEHALKDAVSTVAGLQIASANGNEVQVFTDGASLSAFLTSCTAAPDANVWVNSQPQPSLAEMIAEFRAAGFYDDSSLIEFFTDNVNAFTSYDGNTDIAAAVGQPFETCYRQVQIDGIVNNSFPAGFINKVTISKSPVNYKGWIGAAYAVEHISNTQGSRFGFPIGRYSGGYTVFTPFPILSSSPASIFGFDINPKILAYANKVSPTASAGNNLVFSGSQTNYGNSNNTVLSGDPVNMVTGNMYHTETDIALASRGLPLLFKRIYNSRKREDGPLGWGWTHSFNQKLEFSDTTADGKADSIIWTNGTGALKFMDLDPSTTDVGGVLNITTNNVTIPDGHYFQLQRPHTGGVVQEIEIKEKSGIRYYFEAVDGAKDNVARLVRITDRNGHDINLTYSGNQLTTVTDSDNRVLIFNYYVGTDRIQTINLSWTDSIHEYFYDPAGHLKAYRNPLDRDKGIDSTHYSYYSDSDGHNLEHRMKTFRYANGSQMTFEYYANGKTYRHYNAEGETMVFTYNDFRRESSTTDELGRVKSFIFNKDSLPIEITDSLGGKELYFYEDSNDPLLRTKVIDAMGYETQNTYDTNGNLTQQTLPNGATAAYLHFNTFNQPQLIKNVLNDYTLNRYDNQGNLTDTIVFKKGFGAAVDPATFNPEANSSQILGWTKLAYDGNGKLASSRQVKDFSDQNTGPSVTFDYTDSVNSTEGVVPTSVSYLGDIDGNGIIDPNEGLGTYASQYDAQNRLTKGYNGALYPVDYKFDAAGRLTEGTDALGAKRLFKYDESGLLTTQSLLANDNGQVVLADNSVIAYDKVNRRTSSTDASGAKSNFEYDAAGNLTKALSPDGYCVYFDYDGNNRVTRVYDEEGNSVQRKLDLIGRVKQLIDPNGNVTKYAYYGPAENGRIKRVTDAEDRWTEFHYNKAGQVTMVEDSAGRQTLSSYDALGRVTRVVSPVFFDIKLGNIRPLTVYEYNSLGHQTAVYAGYTNAGGVLGSDNKALQARYEYDDFGRLLKNYDAANNLWQVSEYDVHGNVKSSSDPLGHVTSATYGFGGVLESQTTTGPGGIAAGSESISYDRNALGQPKSISSRNVSYNYQYDTAHRLAKVTDSRGGSSVAYDYSIGGLLNSMTDSYGNETGYLYDPVGRLTGIRTPDKGLISYIYDAGGRLQQKVFPNDLKTAYTYFKDNQVKSIVTTDGSTEKMRHEYTYNSAGDTATASHTLGSTTQSRSYEYDGLGRLTKEIDSVAVADLDVIAYDQFGNRRERTVGGQKHVYSHNNLHQITNIRQDSDVGPVIANFDYDDNGNMTSKTFAGTTAAIGYDALDRVNTVTKDGIASEQYAYDHGIRRIKKTVGSAAVDYHYSGPDIIAEYSNGVATPQAIYAHGAAMDDPLWRKEASNDPLYYHGDAQGSVVGMSDKTGALTASNRYDAWGNVTAKTGSTAQYGYSGREPNDNGLIYYRSRYYDPEIGRFTQMDPKGFIDGVNRYTYVLNSPVNYVDPWGTEAQVVTATGNSGAYGINFIVEGVSRVLGANDVFRSAFSGELGAGLGAELKTQLGPIKFKSGAKVSFKGEADLSPNLLGRVEVGATLIETSFFDVAKFKVASEQYDLMIDEGKVTKTFTPAHFGGAITPNKYTEVNPYKLSVGATIVVPSVGVGVDFEKIYEAAKIIIFGQKQNE